MGDIITNDAVVLALVLCCVGSRVASFVLNGRFRRLRRDKPPTEDNGE